MKQLGIPAFLFVLLVSTLWSTSTWAQGQEADSPYGFEFGVHVGKLLPNQIDGVTEIVPGWGFRAGWPTGPNSAVEFGGILGKGEGAEWTNVSISLRMDIPIETLTGIAFIGGDVTHFQGVNTAKKTFGGGHVGGGVMTLIADELWFRTDMKFNVNPGTSLYFGFGFMLRFGSDGGSGPE